GGTFPSGRGRCARRRPVLWPVVRQDLKRSMAVARGPCHCAHRRHPKLDTTRLISVDSLGYQRLYSWTAEAPACSVLRFHEASYRASTWTQRRYAEHGRRPGGRAPETIT